MNSRHLDPLGFPLVAAAASLLAVAAATLASPNEGESAQGACGWEAIANSTMNVFHASSAYDTANERMYIYGGLDRDYGVSSRFEVLDLSGALLEDARHSPLAVGGALERFGAAGAFRSGKGDLSAAYFIGGLDDLAARQARSDVQVYVPAARTWSRPAVTNAALFEDRVFASAAYDPVHDVVWVVGGVAVCQFTNVLQGAACPARAASTQYLTFDAATGQPTWNTLPGAAQSFYGASMVYDEVGQRMIIFGGTSTIMAGDTRLLQLDLGGADAARASIKPLVANGTAPQLYFHGGGHDSTNRRVLFYGGVIRNYLETNEVPNEATWALDLAGARPAWSKLSPAGNPKVRIGGVIAYAARHAVVVVALGRDKTTQDGDPAAIESETVQRATYVMTCAGPAVASPVPTTSPPGSPTPGTATASPTAPSTATASPTATTTTPPTATRTPTATLEPPTATPTSAPPDAYLPIAYRG